MWFMDDFTWSVSFVSCCSQIEVKNRIVEELGRRIEKK
jgi:hypothetical protein